MKTAVSIPDDLFEDADKLASRLKTSRSQLYARALNDFVSQHQEDKMTEAMNAVMEGMKDEEDSFSKKAASQILRNVEW